MKHLKGLDGIRALAVLLVVTAHSGFDNVVPGGFGVTVFFFLSGFLITTLLQKEFENHNTINYKNFMIRRGLRIFVPLYIVYFSLLLLNGLNIYPADYTFEGILAQILFLTNYVKIYGNPNILLDGTGILWSLAVEEHFYILFPLFFLFLMKRSRNHLIIFSIFMCVIILVWRVYLASYINSYARFYLATDTRFDSILFGVLLSLFMTKYSLFVETTKRLEIKDYSIIFIAILVLLFTFLYRDEYFRNTFRYTVQGLALIPLFYFVVTRPNLVWFSWLNNRVLIRVGLYSYMIYLTHVPVMHVLKYYFNISDGVVLLILLMSISYVLAKLSYVYIERPIQRYKKKFN